MTTDKSYYKTFLDAHQRETIAAAMERIIPSGDTPGAREAGTIDFLDRYLSGIGFIYALPDGSGFEVLRGKQATAWRARVESAQQKYVTGVEQLDRVSHDRGGRPFTELPPEQQDDVLQFIERPEDQQKLADKHLAITYGGPVEPALQQTTAEADLGFFALLVAHTRQGFLSDPIYGGNRDHIGWQTIGFPGPSSLAEVHQARYSTLEYFADNRNHPGEEQHNGSQQHT